MQQLQAQQTTAEKIERLEQKKEEIVAEEKAALKQTVETINLQLEKNEITREEADRLKEEAAKRHALNIENRLAIIENEIAWITRNEGEIDRDNDNFPLDRDKRDRERSRENRTSSSLVIAAGLNNAIEEGGSFNDLDFKVGGSRFFEIGMAWRTRVFSNSNWLRVKYGFSFQFNGLKPTDNRYFVEDGELTRLEVHPIELNKSKFRMDNLVIPLHFEIGPSESAKTNWGTWYSTEDKFRIGLGGFAGVNLGERQKLKYEVDGDDVKQKMKNDFNTNDLVYGLSGYIGWGGTSLYAKYDLNPIFQEPNVALHNVSVGVRFDLR